MSYRLFFAMIDSPTVIWELLINNRELLAGMLSVGVGIIEDLNASLPQPRFYLDSDTDVSRFRLLSDVPEDELRTNSLGHLQQDSMVYG